MTKAASQYKAPAIERGARILEYLSVSGKKPSLSEIARALGYGKSSVHGLLRAMESVGWIDRDGGGFSVGKRLKDLAGEPGGHRNITETARPFMEELAEKIGESVYLGRPLGDRVLILNCVEGRGEMRIASKPGVALPLFAAATGKAYFAALSEEEARRRVYAAELPKFTERTVTDPEKFLAETAACRANGYAMDDEEYMKGVRAVSSPIVKGGRAVAILWIVGFANSLDDATMAVAAKEITRDSVMISRLLETED